MPKVSVVMSNYNRSWIVSKAIQSVLDQSFVDLELLVVDDGSTDDSIEVIRSFKDDRLKLLQGEHKGAGVARNQGIKSASGEYLAYLDTDNTWHSNFLEVMLKEVIQPFVFGYCSQNMFLVAGSRETPQIVARKIRNIEYNPVKLTYTNFIDINSVLHLKSLIGEVGGFDETLKSLEDWDLFVRMVLRHPFHIKQVDQVLCDYFYYLKSIDQTNTNVQVSERNLKKYFGLRQQSEGDEEIVLAKIRQTLSLN